MKRERRHDGLEALDVAETFRPDVVFLDIGMPKLNGYETAPGSGVTHGVKSCYLWR